MKNERPIIAVLAFLTLLEIVILAVMFPELVFLTGTALGAALSWITTIIFFYFRKKGPG